VKQILCHLHTQFDYELVARLILLKYLLAWKVLMLLFKVNAKKPSWASSRESRCCAGLSKCTSLFRVNLYAMSLVHCLVPEAPFKLWSEHGCPASYIAIWGGSGSFLGFSETGSGIVTGKLDQWDIFTGLCIQWGGDSCTP
jgi:hypothetical protein